MRAVLDANVLFPTILREILVDVADAGLYEPLWSARILDEWRYAAARLGPEGDMIAGAEIAALIRRFPDASVPATTVLAVDLPDPADAHVVETALDGQAAQIVTANLRDFPRHQMAVLGLRAIHPDAFLLDRLAEDRITVQVAVSSACHKAIALGGDMSPQQMLKRARLPRLAKALRG